MTSMFLGDVEAEPSSVDDRGLWLARRRPEIVEEAGILVADGTDDVRDCLSDRGDGESVLAREDV